MINGMAVLRACVVSDHSLMLCCECDCDGVGLDEERLRLGASQLMSRMHAGDNQQTTDALGSTIRMLVR